MSGGARGQCDNGRIDLLRTDRLLLRRWRAEDEAPMAAINRDPDVGRHLNRPVDEAAVVAFYGFIVGHWEAHGYGPWAIEFEDRFVGFTGLAHVPTFLAAAGPGPELGWRLDPSVWGRGLATEAAAAAKVDAFDRLGFAELISIIHPENARSQRVAEKLGMVRTRTVENPLIGRVVHVWAVSRAS